MKVLVTGANGLVGRPLCSALVQSGDQVIHAVRTSTSPRHFSVGDICQNTQWSTALSSGIDVVVHLAGKVPTLDAGGDSSAECYYQVNISGTANLARQCAQHGVKRFIFVSSVKVLGEGKSQPYGGEDLARPMDAYGISKWEAEQALWKISSETGMEVVVLRPPLVYGEGVKGNFLHLMQVIDKGLPLPLGAVQNKRSFIYLGNLVDSIRLCLTHPKAAGKTFLVSDGDDVSTPELVRRIAVELGCQPFLVPVPTSWMRWLGEVLGKQAAVERLLSSLCVDITPLREELGWTPPYTMQAGLKVTAQWYRKTKVSA